MWWYPEFSGRIGRQVETFSGLPSHIHKAVITAYIEGASVNELDSDDMQNLISPWLSEPGRHSFYTQFAQADEKYTAAIEPYLGEIRCPVNIFCREDDPWTPLARGKT